MENDRVLDDTTKSTNLIEDAFEQQAEAEIVFTSFHSPRISKI